MPPDEVKERRRAEAMSQAQFQGETIVHLKYLRESDTKQWDEIKALNQKAEHAVTVELCEDHRRRIGNLNMLKLVGALVALLGGIAGLIVLLI